MTKVRLKSLTISAFRGSPDPFTLTFETDRQLTIIYGENGSGKTTICDALEFLAKGKVGSLDDRGMGGGLEKFYPFAGKSAADLAIRLETSSGACEGRLNGKNAVVTPPDAVPRIAILRQRDIARLVEAKPAERYEAIRRFIDISEFEQSEKVLSDLVKSLKAEEKGAQTAENQSLDSLQGFFEAAGKPAGLNPVSWAKARLADASADKSAETAALGQLRVAYAKLESMSEQVRNQQQAVDDVERELAGAVKAFEDAAALVGSEAQDILDLMEAGGRYVHAHPDLTECPLCSSAEKVQGLAERITEQLQRSAALRSARSNRQHFEAAREKAQHALQQQEVAAADAAAALRQTAAGFKWPEGLAAPDSVVPTAVGDLASWLKHTSHLVASWQATEDAWRDEAKFVKALRSAVEQYESNLHRRMTLQELRPRAEKALEVCMQQRRLFTDGILTDIATRVGEIYEKVHPGEGLEKIALPLDPNKRASIELEAKFSGLAVPPQAYFSQSHLDTLGLCVFLALAARDNPGETILILDDVLGSVDEPHVERVVSMIYEVSRNFRHTIVTTHYRPWREKFRWGFLKPDQVCQFVELRQWTLGDGMTLTGSTPEIARLRTLLTDPNPDIQAISGKAGVILEALLDFLTLKYTCAVPRRAGGSYTLGELLPTVNGKLLAALKVEALDPTGSAPAAATELKPIIDQISSIAQTRNVMGAHFNTLSFDLYPQDGIKFAKLVEQLADALICPDHGWPNKDKSGSYWNNGGDTRRLHPLKKPA